VPSTISTQFGSIRYFSIFPSAALAIDGIIQQQTARTDTPQNARSLLIAATWTCSRFSSTDVLLFYNPPAIMALTIGTQLGSHEIIELLGKGGMGEVYRAKDLKLKRDVAIKILPEEFSRDADRVSRFQREAEILASLNHPNIGTIYDLEEA